MQSLTLLTVVSVLLLFLCIHCRAISWLALGMSGAHIDQRRPQQTCRSLRGLTKRQVRLCRKNIEHMDSVALGALNAYKECQFQFQKRRWNCTMVDPVSIFGDVVLKEGTREAAFVHAIASAGVAHKVTRDCSRGVLDKCGCDQSMASRAPSADFRWSGCSDNVHYGIAFTRNFVDASERGRAQSHERMLMNLHNNRAGRQVLEKYMRTECKCHGLSGSCELKTCWRSMPSFREVGTIIKDKFDGATEVKLVRDSAEQRARMVRVNPHFKRHTHTDLVYLVDSPDYCVADPSRGVLGTSGRICNETSQGIDGCELLCCHRGYITKTERTKDMCNCKFHYCCRVDCEPCEKLVDIHICR